MAFLKKKRPKWYLLREKKKSLCVSGGMFEVGDGHSG